jgi:predicted AAA+ superfamily ATPase
VYVDLRRRNQEIYYYKTSEDYEVDFYLPKENSFIQVSQHFESEETKERELRAVVSAIKEKKEVKEDKKFPTCLLVTESEKEVISKDGINIHVVPLYEWLLRK